MISMWMTSAVFERLAGSLLHFVWQGAAIAIVTAVALRLLRNRSAECRYATALVALAAMLLAPFVTFTFYSETGALTLRLLGGLNGAAKIAASEAAAVDVAVWTQRIVVVWMIGVIAFLVRLMGGWLLSRRLLRSAAAVATPVMKEAIERARAGLNFHGRVRLLTGDRIETPIVIGWLRPAILLPASALTGLSPDQLLAILAHELAHIRRHDFLVNGIQRAVECVLFYHPAVWWVSGRIRVERERCCDDLAVSVCGDRLLYAQALVALERARSAELILALPTAGIGVKDRVRRILGAGTSRDWQSAVAALVFAAILVGAGMFQPTLAGPTVSPVAQVLTPALQPLVQQAQAPTPAPPLSAILAIATAEGVQTRAALEQQQPATRSQLTQPAIAPSREAARDRLGMLRVEYSADSFVKQAAEGDTIAIKTFLAAGMNINARNEKGYTALMKAAETGQTETAQALLVAGADPNLLSGETRISALALAATRGDLPMMKVLIAGGADVNLKIYHQGETALIAAASGGQREAVTLLLDNKASIDTRSTSRGTALVAASCAGHVDVARTLVDRGADLNARNPDQPNAVPPGPWGQTALGCAAQHRGTEFIQLLLDKGADINLTSYRGQTPLHLALQNPREVDKATANALVLISRGANVNATIPEHGATPLDLAVEYRLLEVVRALLDKGANPNKSAPRTTLLTSALTSRPNADIALLLIDRGADVNAVADSTGGSRDVSPLYLAIQANQAAVVRALLAKGANPNVSCRNCPTTLRAATESPEIMQLLISAGAKQ